ncbi:Sorting nexin, cytoplasm-to-vacuole targeting pathway/endosomal sorting [Savitreella phatthalungensis]
MSFEDNDPFGNAADRPSYFQSPASTADSSVPPPPPLHVDSSTAADTPHLPVFPEMQRRSSITVVSPCRHLEQIPAFLESGGQIYIPDAGKNQEGHGSHIVYKIRTGDLEARRRYSDFESLRSNLARLYPCVVVPPIPEKQSLTDYTAGPAKAREDANLIEHRKRMLEVFLRRLSAHKDLRSEPVFLKFLDSNVSWSEVLVSAPISLLPKNVLRGPPSNPASAHGDLAYSNLPIPSHTSKKSKTMTDPVSERLRKVENSSKEFESLLNSTIEKTNRRMVKRYGDLAVDYNELGAQFNAFSLSEQGSTAVAVEKLGQACDETYLATTNLVNALGHVFGEPLQEQGQLLSIVRQVLKYRRQKITQVEHATDLLESKRHSLDGLVASENEARRIDGALGRYQDAQPPAAGEFPPTHDLATPQRPAGGENSTTATTTPQQTQTPYGYAASPGMNGSTTTTSSPSTGPRKSSLSSSGFKLMGRLNHAIHSLTDTDPALARRQKIGSTRELIASLETAHANAGRDLAYIDDKVSQEVGTFELGRQEDWRGLMAAVATAYIDWASKCLESWEEAERSVA